MEEQISRDRVAWIRLPSAGETVESLEGFRAQYSSIGEGTEADRIAWLKRCFAGASLTLVPPDQFSAPGASGGPHDVFLIGGSDICGMISCLRARLIELRGKPKIAVTLGANPSERAQLLLGGFDDVFELSRIDIVEARARILAIYGRYANAALRVEAEMHNDLDLAAVSRANKLTDREKRFCCN